MLNMTTDFEKSPSIINRMLKAVFSKHGSSFTAHSTTRCSISVPAAYIVRKIDRVSGYLNKLLWLFFEPDSSVIGFEREDLTNTTAMFFQLLKSYIP